MSWKQWVVCLLVFAASVSLILAGGRAIRNLGSFSHHRRSPRRFKTMDARGQIASENGIRPAPTANNFLKISRPNQIHASLSDDQNRLRPDLKALDIPLAFEPAAGQMDGQVKFVGRGTGLTVLLTSDEMMVRFPRRPVSDSGRQQSVEKLHLTPINSFIRMRLRQATRGCEENAQRISASGFVGSASATAAFFNWRGEQKLPGESNYFLEKDPRKWRTNVPHFAQVSASSSIPGLAMVVYGNAGGLEYDLRLAPHADASKLRLEFSGAKKLWLDAQGDLLLEAGGNELRMRQPAVYEESPAGVRKRVRGKYVIERDGSVGFRIAPYDTKSTLVIDPSLSVAYSTFLGGLGNDVANSIARDSMGNIYVGGTTDSAGTFPEQGSQAIGPAGSGTDFFIAKINPAASGASSLVYLTFLGGSGDEAGGLLAVDSNGDAAITGTTTSPDFPVTDASVLTTGANDVAVSEINPAGNSLLFSTLFGGNGQQAQFSPGGLALDPSGNIFVASDTSSTNLPVTSGALQSTITGNQVDGFLAVFQPAATPSLTYCTYLGTEANKQMGVGGIAVDAAGAAYIAGYTSNLVGSAFPVKNAFQSTYGGGPFDAFLMKISPLGQSASDLVYATLLGGGSLDEALAVAVDAASPPNAYVTGMTQSADFPTSPASGGTAAAYQTTLHANAAANAFLTVIAQNSATGMTSIVYSTYLGGSQSDAGQGVAVVPVPNAVAVLNAVYVTGSASSWDFPWHDNFQPFNGTSDAFVAKLDPTSSGVSSLIYSTPLGGTAPTGGTATASANGISVDGAGHLFIVGQTTAADFPTAGSPGNAFQSICSSCQQLPAVADAFVVAVQENLGSEPSVYFARPNITFPPSLVGVQNVSQLVGVVNGGEAPLHIFSVGIIGPYAQDFSLLGPASCTAQPINVGTACSFEVGFVASIVEPEAAAISFSDDAPGSPQVIELAGQGGSGNQPLAVPVPASTDFGSVTAGQSSTPLGITLHNNGTSALYLSSVTLAGTDRLQFVSPFTGDTCIAGAVVQPSSTCILRVVFSPNAAGTFHAEIEFADNSGGVAGATQVALLTGKGALPAGAVISPGSLGFGNETVGVSSAAQTVTLTSTGTAALSVTGITIAGANAADFGIVVAGSNPCPAGNSTLAVGASCTVKIEFTPQSAGTKAAVLSFTDNAAAIPQMVTLGGTATAGPPVQILPVSWNFPAESSGSPSAAKQFTVSNMGSSSVSIGITVTGPNAADFLETDNCVGARGLGPSSSCLVNVSFDPVELPPAQSQRAATMTINYGGAGNPLSVPLSGTATQAAVSFNLASINLGNQLAGTAGQPQSIQATNGGNGSLVFSKIAINGANSSDFSETDNCAGSIPVPINVAPNGMCTVQVTFQPQVPTVCGTGAGLRSAMLTLTDNAPGSPQTISLAGTESDFCLIPQSGTAPGSISLGVTANYNVVSYPAGSPNGFSGVVTTSCTGFPAGGNCTATPPSMTLGAGSTSPVQVNVTVATAELPGQLPRPPHSGWSGEYSLNNTWRLATVFVALLVCLALMRLASTSLSKKRPWRCVQACALLVVYSIGLAACGGGGGGNSGGDPPPPAIQTYTIAFAGTSNCPSASNCAMAPSRQVQLTLTVQQ